MNVPIARGLPYTSVKQVCITDIHILWEMIAKYCRRYQISISFPFELFCTHG